MQTKENKDVHCSTMAPVPGGKSAIPHRPGTI